MKMLIAEDDATSRMILRNILTHWKYSYPHQMEVQILFRVHPLSMPSHAT